MKYLISNKVIHRIFLSVNVTLLLASSGVAWGKSEANQQLATPLVFGGALVSTSLASATLAATVGVNATSCSAIAVQTAVNSATSGMIVQIPAGDCNWGTAQVTVPAGLTLQGAGKDITIIRRSGVVTDALHLVKFDCSNGKNAIFSDMTLVGNGNTSISDKGLGLMNGCVDFKVSNAKFTKFGSAGIAIDGSITERGVIFNSEFVANTKTGAGYGVMILADGSWPALDLGSKNAVFIEDSSFQGNTTNLSANDSGRFVFRFNKVVVSDIGKNFSMVQVNGKSSAPHGARSWEIYNNQFSTSLTSGSARTAIGISGGDGVAFNNTMTTTIARPIELDVDGFTCGTYPGPDQVRSAYFWNNTKNTYANGIANNCTSSISLGRDYFTSAKPGYVAYSYPHPLRTATVTTSTTTTCNFPDWVGGKSYVIGDKVRYAANGKFYQASHNNPGWDPTISTYFWDSYACSGTTPTPTPTPTPTAPVITLANCSIDSVQAAVNSASSGTTVSLPAGDCNWGTRQLNVPGGVYLKGAGKTSTIIRRIGNVANTAYLVAYDCSNGKPAKISGMSLIGNGDGAIQDKGLGLLNGCQDFKVANSKFSNFIFSAVYVGDAPNQRGVIYGNDFINNYSAALKNLGYGVVVYGGGAWPALDLGSANAVFVEDNYFSGNRHNIASNNGSVYVFRHNTVIGQDAAKDYAMTDSHGLSSSARGSRSYEVYNNDYSTNITSGLQRTAVGIRGGDGVIFNNTATATISRTVELMVEGFGCGTYPGPDQIRSLYIWNNSNNSSNGYTTNGIDNTCPSSIGLNRDYFLTPKPGYTPYTYPHPTRAVF